MSIIAEIRQSLLGKKTVPLEPLTLDEIREITYDAVECGQ